MASVCTLSGFQFADNECNLASFAKQTVFSPRKKKLQEIRTVDLEGELIYSDTTTIVSHINSLESALNTVTLDFRYTVAGTLSHQLLNSSDCCSGVRVVSYSLPKGTPEQLATTRTFKIRLQGTYDAAESDLVSWTESIETIGTGGPKFFVVDTATIPIAVFTSTASAVYYQQTGMAIGYRNYPDPPGPVTTQGEFVWRRRIARISGRQTGNGLRFFGRKWSYYIGRDVTTFGAFDPLPTSQ